MPIKDVLRYELIGLHAQVTQASNKSLVGVEGTIIDETKNLLILEDKGKIRKVLKDQATFLITFQDKRYEIQGKLLVGRPEERLKKIRI